MFNVPLSRASSSLSRVSSSLSRASSLVTPRSQLVTHSQQKQIRSCCYLCSLKILKAISNSMLAMLVLLSGMGFYMNHTVCNLSGEQCLSINMPIEDCEDNCNQESGDPFEDSCCNHNNSYFKEDVRATSTKSRTKHIASAFAFIPLHEVFTEVNCAESCCFHLPEAPDSLPSVKRYILLETYLI